MRHRQRAARADCKMFFSAYFGQHQIRDTNVFKLPSFYQILTKLHGDITNRFTRNLSKKFQAYPIIKHYVTAQSNFFCPIFMTISTPISTKSFGQLWKPYCRRSSQIFKMISISFKELTIFRYFRIIRQKSSNFAKLREF